MNNVVLVGRLTKDIELRTIGQGVSVANFTLAVDRRFKNKQGERETDFIACIAWKMTAEFIAKYFKKGDKIGIVGEIQTRSYEGNSGNKVYVTEVKVEQAHFVDSKGNGQGYNEDVKQTTTRTNAWNNSNAQNKRENFSTDPDEDYGLPFNV